MEIIGAKLKNVFYDFPNFYDYACQYQYKKVCKIILYKLWMAFPGQRFSAKMLVFRSMFSDYVPNGI